MKTSIITFLSIFMFAACSNIEPSPIKLNSDNCDYCKMTIADLRFSTELITEKGKVFKFDDLSCLKNYLSENSSLNNPRIYVADFNAPETFLDGKTAMYAAGEGVSSPMGGNMAAFAEKIAAENFAKTKSAEVSTWNDLPN